MQVRAVLPDEYARAGRLVVAAYRALPGAHLSGDYAAELADVERRAKGAEVLVALQDDGALVGCVTFVGDPASPWAELLEPGEAGIRMLAVDPSEQRHGVGQLLVAECIGRAREVARTSLLLHTTPWMTAAQRLYERSGFERFPARDWMAIPEVPLLAYRLVLE
jgi:ribosomal protein S18 acetylase RimI-like enzyme